MTAGPIAQFAQRYGINEKTVIKWRNGKSVKDMAGSKEWRSPVFSPMEEAAIVALSVRAALPLDNGLIALKDVIPHVDVP